MSDIRGNARKRLSNSGKLRLLKKQLFFTHIPLLALMHFKIPVAMDDLEGKKDPIIEGKNLYIDLRNIAN